MEDPNRFDPSTQHKKRYKNYVVRERMCPHCGKWFKPEKRPVCIRTAKCRKALGIERTTPMINTGSCFRGWYEHLDRTPVWVESKAQLYRECVKRGVQSPALMSGGEMKRPKGA